MESEIKQLKDQFELIKINLEHQKKIKELQCENELIKFQNILLTQTCIRIENRESKIVKLINDLQEQNNDLLSELKMYVMDQLK